MTTDWILIRRAAVEIGRVLGGLRVVDAGFLDDGRCALRFAGRGRDVPVTLAIDTFGSPPLVTLEPDELAVRADPGWLRTLATTVRGMRLAEVTARRGDRLIVLDFGSASRFGVESRARVVLELVPRYGNVVVVRDRLVVAAAKQFSPADNQTRAVQVGFAYEPPPLPSASLDERGFAVEVASARDARGLSRALGSYLPELPRLLAASLVAGVPVTGEDTQAAAALAQRAATLVVEAEAAADGGDPLYVYRDDAGRLVAVHVVPLAQFATGDCSREPSLLAVFAQARSGARDAQIGGAAERLRAALTTRIERRARAARDESARIAARLADVEASDRARASGDALFTHAAEVPPGATSFVPPTNPDLTIELDPQLDAKANARRYFARYRKAVDALPHLGARRTALAARLAALDALAFEVERADAATLSELAADLDRIEGRATRATAATHGRRRAVLRVDRPSGARIYVGRSPRENVELTFTIARPDDWWFHARGIPGSHVVLQPANGAEPRDDDLDAAANLAAAHSRARTSASVEIDYTQRKHVRKQRDAAPGLVWYTHARTRVGRPADVDAELQPIRAR